MSLTPTQLSELQTIVETLRTEFSSSDDDLWQAAIRLQKGGLGPVTGSGGQAAFDAAVADIVEESEQIATVQGRQGGIGQSFDVATFNVVPIEGELPAGALGDVIYIDTAPNTYLATDVINLTPAGPNSVVLSEVGTQVARTVSAANGGMEVNNLNTGAGFERVLTTADLSMTPDPLTIGRIIITNVNDPDLVDTTVALNVGSVDPDNNAHIEIGPTQIQQKQDATTVDSLGIQPLGGDLDLGDQTGGSGGDVRLYRNAVVVAQTDDSNLGVLSPGNGDPTVPDSVAITLAFLSQDQNEYGRIDFGSGDPGDMTIINNANGAALGALVDGGTNIWAGSSSDMALFDPVNDEPRFGTGVAIVTTGVYVQGTTANNPATGGVQDQQIEFRNSGVQATFEMGFAASADFTMTSRVHGGAIRLNAEDTGGTPRLGLSIDPDGITTVRGDTDVSIQAAAGSVLAQLLANGQFRSDSSISLNEIAAAPADEAARGQFWVRNDSPNTPMFTDDAGTDFELNVSGGSPFTTPLVVESVGNTTTEARLFEYALDNGTVVGRSGYVADSTLVFENIINTAFIEIAGDDTSDARQLLIQLQPNTGGRQIHFFPEVGASIERFALEAGGIIALHSDTNTDAEVRRIDFNHQNGTLRGFVGHNGGDLMIWDNRIDGGAITIQARDSGSASREILNGDPDALTTLTGDTGVNINTRVAGTVNIQSGGVSRLQVDGPNSRIVFNDFPLFIEELAAPGSDVAGFGQLYVRNDTPNRLSFVDDGGDEFELLPYSVVQGADDTVNNSTTLVNTDLVISNVETGLYRIDVLILARDVAVSGCGIRFNIAVTGVASQSVLQSWSDLFSGANPPTENEIGRLGETHTFASLDTGSGTSRIQLIGHCRVTSGTNSFTVQFAQNTAQVGDLDFETNSFMCLTKIGNS